MLKMLFRLFDASNCFTGLSKIPGCIQQRSSHPDYHCISCTQMFLGSVKDRFHALLDCAILKWVGRNSEK